MGAQSPSGWHGPTLAPRDRWLDRSNQLQTDLRPPAESPEWQRGVDAVAGPRQRLGRPNRRSCQKPPRKSDEIDQGGSVNVRECWEMAAATQGWANWSNRAASVQENCGLTINAPSHCN